MVEPPGRAQELTKAETRNSKFETPRSRRISSLGFRISSFEFRVSFAPSIPGCGRRFCLTGMLAISKHKSWRCSFRPRCSSSSRQCPKRRREALIQRQACAMRHGCFPRHVQAQSASGNDLAGIGATVEAFEDRTRTVIDSFSTPTSTATALAGIGYLKALSNSCVTERSRSSRSAGTWPDWHWQRADA
jgi:hypothetical protein